MRRRRSRRSRGRGFFSTLKRKGRAAKMGYGAAKDGYRAYQKLKDARRVWRGGRFFPNVRPPPFVGFPRRKGLSGLPGRLGRNVRKAAGQLPLGLTPRRMRGRGILRRQQGVTMIY